MVGALAVLDRAPAAAQTPPVQETPCGEPCFRLDGRTGSSPTGGGASKGGSGTYRRLEQAFDPMCSQSPDGLKLRYVTYNVNHEVLSTGPWQCLVLSDPGAVIPAPPDFESLLEIGFLPPPVIGVAPPARGLVGFPTRLWYPETDEFVLEAGPLGGWTGTIRAHLDRYEWDFEGADETVPRPVVGEHPGDVDLPSNTALFDYRCQCTLVATAVWHATATFTHPNLAGPYVEELEPRRLTVTQPYPVIAIEAVIVGDPSD